MIVLSVYVILTRTIVLRHFLHRTKTGPNGAGCFWEYNPVKIKRPSIFSFQHKLFSSLSLLVNLFEECFEEAILVYEIRAKTRL